MYFLFQLKTLALSIEASHLISPDLTLFKKLYLLKKLCLHITRKHPKSSYGLYKFFTELFALQELWVRAFYSFCFLNY